MKNKRWIAGCAIATALVFLGAAIYGYLVVHPLIFGPPLNDQPPFPLHTAWSQSLDSDILDLTVGDTSNIILAKTSRALSALDTTNGKLIWRASIGSQVSSYPAIIAAGRAFVTDSHALHSFDLKTGAILWQQPLNSESTWVTDASAYIVLVNSVSDNITAYQADSGRTLWTAPVGRGHIPAYIDNDTVYIVDDAIDALAANSGRKIWHVDYPGSSYAIHTPGVIYFTANESVREFRVVAFDLRSGAELWSRNFPTSGSEHLGVQDNVLFVLNDLSASALALDTAHLIWTEKLDGSSHPNVINDTVYIMQDFHGVIQSLDMRSGQLSGALRVSGPILLYSYHDNLVSKGNILFSAQRSTLSAYSK